MVKLYLRTQRKKRICRYLKRRPWFIIIININIINIIIIIIVLNYFSPAFVNLSFSVHIVVKDIYFLLKKEFYDDKDENIIKL